MACTPRSQTCTPRSQSGHIDHLDRFAKRLAVRHGSATGTEPHPHWSSKGQLLVGQKKQEALQQEWKKFAAPAMILHRPMPAPQGENSDNQRNRLRNWIGLMRKSKLSVDVGARVLGYTHGSRQYSRKVRLVLPRPRTFFEEDAKQYLNEKLQVTELGDFDVAKAADIELDPVIKRLVGTTELIAGHALRFSSIPAFERIIVLSSRTVSQSGRKFEVQFLAPTVAHQNPMFVRNAFEIAATIAVEFTLPAYKRNNLDTLTDKSLARFIELTSARSNGGYSMRFMLEAAFDRGIPISHLGFGHYQFGYGRHAKLCCRSATASDSMIGALLTSDKLQCITYMKSAGIPVPLSKAVKDAKEAQAIAQQTGFPVVIKPSNRDRGEGVTVDILSDVSAYGSK